MTSYREPALLELCNVTVMRGDRVLLLGKAVTTVESRLRV